MSDIRHEVSLNALFDEFPLSKFIDQYLYRLPFALPRAAHSACQWGTWETFSETLASPGADCLVVRANERYSGKSPTDQASAKALSDEGYTILIKHVERHHAGIARLAVEFAGTFRGPVDVHLYITPPKQFGFSWHYDAEDVFILQLTGEKEYSLRKNTVNPWPLLETLPQDMQYERELMPLMRVVLLGGDLLYIPAGYWHRAETSAQSETAFSLAIGIVPRTAMDLFDLLRPQLLESLLWRQRLPLSSHNDNDPLIYETLLKMLADDLARTLTGERFREQLLNWNKTDNG